MGMILCKGVTCPVKGTCLRHTRLKESSCDETFGMTKCTNQKYFVQDVDKVNIDSRRN